MNKLTPKQERFVAEYLVDLNATGAARRAGYSEKTAEVIGYENLRKPQIAEAIQAARDIRAKKLDIDAGWVLNKLVRNRQRADKAKRFGDVNRALEIIGRHTGGFGEKHEHTGKNGGPIAVTDMTDEQLDRIIAAGVAVYPGFRRTSAPPEFASNGVHPA